MRKLNYFLFYFKKTIFFNFSKLIKKIKGYEKQKLFYQLYLVRLVYLLYIRSIYINTLIYIYSKKISHAYLIYRWVNTQILCTSSIIFILYYLLLCCFHKKKMESSFIIMSCHFIFSLNTTTRYYFSRLVDTLTSM